jgi:hypothetical protein
MSPNPFFTVPGRDVSWSADFGITSKHWREFSLYAFNKYYLMVRTGKPAAIPWIEKGYPGKPRELGFVKIDRELGLLIAGEPEHERRVKDVGHFVLEARKVTGPTGAREQFVAVNKRGEELKERFDQSWARRGIVVDAETHLPFTSDYDLAAVLDARRLNYEQTLGSISSPGNLTSALIEKVRSDLNARFGSKRIQHGSQAQYQGDLSSAKQKDEAHMPGESEQILAFCADSRVKLFSTGGDWGAMQLRDMLKSLHPEQSHVFHQ